MRLKCPNCGEVLNRVRGHYEIIAESDLRFTYDRTIIKPAVAPLEVSTQSIKVRQITCPACGHLDKLEAWVVILGCPGCGDPLAEFPASANIPAEEFYCRREGNFLCRGCAVRYGACDVCSENATCPIINKEVT